MKESSGGIGVVGLLGVVFVTLKLCGVIDWSWLWVLAPFWVGLAVMVAIVLVVLVIAFLREWALDRRLARRREASRNNPR